MLLELVWGEQMNQILLLKISVAIMIISIAGLIFMVGYGFGTGEFNLKLLSKPISTTGCSNQSLSDAIECLNTNLTSWFKYNINQTGKTLSELDFVTFGGVCVHASEWYVSKVQELGYNAKTITIVGDKGAIGHMFAVAWNDNVSEYCVIDQTSYDCRRLA